LRNFKRFSLSVFFLLFIYLNIDGILVSSGVRIPSMASNGQGILPNKWYFQYYFNFFGIFSRRTNYTSKYILLGSPTLLEKVPMEPNTDLIKINNYRYQTHFIPEANRKVSLRWIHPELRPSAQARMISKLMEIHNTKYPEKRVSQAMLYRIWWPSDSAGRYARLREARSEFIATVRGSQ